MMKVTVGHLREAYAKYNSEIFGGKLPEVSLAVTSAKSYVGKIFFQRRAFYALPKAEDFRIVLSSRFDMAEDEIDDTIIHEMIHLYIHWNRISDTSAHGPAFRKIMNHVNSRFGRHITVTHRLSRESRESDNVVRDHLFCLSSSPQGQRLITVCCLSALDRIDTVFRHHADVRDVEWYVSRESFFNRFPKVRTAKRYLLSPDDLGRISSLKIFPITKTEGKWQKKR